MLIITYDITNNSLRTKFSKFLEKYGSRIQYSVFEIRNSERILSNIILKIENYFEDKFSESDSILIFNILDSKIVKYGDIKKVENNLIIV